MRWSSACSVDGVDALRAGIIYGSIGMRCGIDRKVLVLLMIAASGPAVFAQQAPSTLPPGWVTPIIPGIVQEPTLLKKFINATDNTIGGDPQDGPYVEWGNMITGSGWISAGPGYRHHVLDGRAVIDASAAVSVTDPDDAVAPSRSEEPRARAGAGGTLPRSAPTS